MAVLVTDFTSFSAQLNRQFGPGCDIEVAAYIGRVYLDYTYYINILEDAYGC